MGYKNLNITEFDNIIKANVGNNSLFGYTVLPNDEKQFKNHVYNNYYSNSEFAKFCEEMKEKHYKIYKAYAEGKGSELVGNPPKMASVSSSSRFCYLALRDSSITVFNGKTNEEKVFEFEKDCDNCLKGTNPQMDAFYEGIDTDYYFEFKCREILEGHAKELSESYNNYLNQWGVQRNGKSVPFEKFGLKEDTLFDIKQFITHLTGIVCAGNDKKKIFSYVYFKPISQNNMSDKMKNLYDALTIEFKTVLQSDPVQKICKDNKIEIRLYFYENQTMVGFKENDNNLKLVTSNAN